MSLSKVIETARGELGKTEWPPGSNRTKYWESYDPKMQNKQHSKLYIKRKK